MSKYIELKENLLGGGRQLDRIADDVLAKLKNIDKLLKKLDDDCNRIGTSSDSKTFHKELKENIFTTTVKLKEATELVNRMDNIQVNNEEQKVSQITALRKKCKEKLDKTTKLIKKIESLEKKNVQEARNSVKNKGGRESSDQESVSKQWMQMDIDEEITRERENDIIELTKLLTEMNAMAKFQAKCIQEQGEDLHFIFENVQETKQNTNKAEIELKEANRYKEQLVQSDTKCLIVAIIVCLVFILLFLLSSSPEFPESDRVPDDSTS